MRRAGALCLFLGLCAGHSDAADLPELHALEGKRIAKIQYDPPEQPLVADDLARAVSLKAGGPLTIEDLRDTVKRLYATGRYSNVEVVAGQEPDGLVLTFRTQLQSFIGAFEVKGKVKRPPGRGQLAAATRLELGAPLRPDSILGAVDSMRQLLERNGFYEAKVTPHLTNDAEHQQAQIEFLVQPGPRARYTTAVVTGDTKESPEKVASWAKFRGLFRWKPVTDENTSAALQRVRNGYNKRDRYMATVDLDSLKYDPSTRRATPTLDVDAGPKVKIVTEGAKLSKGKLHRYVPVYVEKTVNRDLLVQGARNLRDYFQSMGYFDVDVDFEEQGTGTDRDVIVYTIIRGKRHKVATIQIEGNKYFTRTDLRERMYLQPAGLVYLRHGRYSDSFLRRDVEAIKQLYRSNGFRDVKVEADTVDEYQGRSNDIAVVIRIEEGTQWSVSQVNVTGLGSPDPKETIAHLSSLAGQPFSEANVAMDRDYIIRTYQSRGYPDVTFTYQMTPDPEKRQVALQYTVNEGTPKYVRDVLITGMRISRPRLVKPNILINAGDPLSMAVMSETQRRLYELGVFDKVDMAIQNPDGETEHKYVLYQIEEGPRYTIAAGFGAEIAKIGGSQTNLENAAGQTGFSPRVSLDVSRLNLWGLGHSATIQGRFSNLQERGVLTYSAPRYRNVDGRNILVSALYDNSRDVRTFSSKRLEGSAQISKKFTKSMNGLVRFSYRRVSVDPGTLKIEPLLIPILAQPVRIGALSANLIQDRRDDPADSHRGIYNTLDAELASNIFGSQRSFARVIARNSTYHRLGRSQVVLARSLQLGWIGPFRIPHGFTPGESVPFPERFFGGGSTSHRGFPDNQAGPRDPETGFPVGGDSLLFHNTELRFPFISDNFTGAIFHDMGNTYSSPSHFSFRVRQRNIQDFDYMVHAVGFGIRYRTPVGPVRLDLSYSINPPRFKGLKGTYQDLLLGRGTPQVQNVSHFQFFFSIGQSF